MLDKVALPFIYGVSTLVHGYQGLLAKLARSYCESSYVFHDVEYKDMADYINPTNWLQSVSDAKTHIDASAHCEGISAYVYESKWLGMSSLLVGAVGASTIHYAFRRAQYRNYLNKDEREIEKLGEPLRKAFQSGMDAYKSNLTYARNLLSLNAWLHPKAYAAGYESARDDNDQLQESVLERRLPR